MVKDWTSAKVGDDAETGLVASGLRRIPGGDMRTAVRR